MKKVVLLRLPFRFKNFCVIASRLFTFCTRMQNVKGNNFVLVLFSNRVIVFRVNVDS